MKKQNFIIIGALFLLSACGSKTYTMEWNAANGSRADGTVRLVAETHTNRRYAPATAQADALATKRCQVWGYNSAEAFGGSTRVCISSNAKQCLIWENTRVYQCTGTGTGLNSPAAQTPAPVVININNENNHSKTETETNTSGERSLQPIKKR